MFNLNNEISKITGTVVNTEKQLVLMRNNFMLFSNSESNDVSWKTSGCRKNQHGIA